MKVKRFIGLGLSLIMAVSSLNLAFAKEMYNEIQGKALEVFEQKTGIIPDDTVLSEAAVGADATALATLAAYAVEGGNIYYDPNTGEIESCDISVTNAVIPSEINGVAITSIVDYAFNYCTRLTSIIIPNSVTSIGVCQA